MSESATMAQGRTRGHLLALGILAALIGGTWLGAVRPIIGAYAAQRHEAERAADLRADLLRIIAERPALERRRAMLEQASASQRLTLAADSEGVAAAAFQQIVKAAVDRSGAGLQSTQVKAIRADGPYRRIGLRMQMTGTVEQLRQILLALEANEPMIYGEGLEVRARQQMRAIGAKAVEDRTLEIRLDVYGLAKLSA